MQDMTFEANSNDPRCTKDGSCFLLDENDFHKYFFDFRHFVFDSLSGKYSEGVYKIFFKSNKAGYLRFNLDVIFLIENDNTDDYEEPGTIHFDVWLKYCEKDNIYQVTLFDIFMLIDMRLMYANKDDNVRLINIVKSENETGDDPKDSLGNFTLITDVKLII